MESLLTSNTFRTCNFSFAWCYFVEYTHSAFIKAIHHFHIVFLKDWQELTFSYSLRMYFSCNIVISRKSIYPARVTHQMSRVFLLFSTWRCSNNNLTFSNPTIWSMVNMKRPYLINVTVKHCYLQNSLDQRLLIIKTHYQNWEKFDKK